MAAPARGGAPSRIRLKELGDKNLVRSLPARFVGGPSGWSAFVDVHTPTGSVRTFRGDSGQKRNALEAACAAVLEWYDAQPPPAAAPAVVPPIGATMRSVVPRLLALQDAWEWKAHRLRDDDVAPPLQPPPLQPPLQPAVKHERELPSPPPLLATEQPPRASSAPLPSLSPAASAASAAAMASAVPPKRQKTTADEVACEVKVLTYNVLSDSLAKSAWFSHRSTTELSWATRSAVIKKQIAAIDADVVCLQEVQAVHGPERIKGVDHHCAWFDGWLRKEMAMTGAFGSRTAANGVQPPGVQLGNALYWKESRFTPLRVSACVPLLKTVNDACASKDLKLRYGTGDARKTVATMAALECRVTKRVIVFVTTHLPAPRGDKDAQAVLEQTVHAYALVREIAKFCAHIKNRAVDAVVLAGDLNCLPGRNVCQLLERGKLPSAAVKELVANASQPDAPFLQPDGAMVCDAITLANGADGADGADGGEDAKADEDFFWSAMKRALGTEPVTTNHTPTFTGCLDFVYVASSPRVAWQLEAADPSAGLDLARFLPDPETGNGSDHLPVVCTLKARFPKADAVFVLNPPPA